MNHGSLFSGIGGFDLAAEWMGWENVFHCEWEEFPRKVLNYYWPNAISYGDITKTDFNIHRGQIDILTGGFPCQPYSQAGKRLGKEDDRHLWPEMLRAIREIQPTWVVGENVRGLINWNDGLVFDEVQTDLEAQGYQILPFLLPAAAVGAPHRRDRVWFVSRLISDTSCNGCDLSEESKKGCQCKQSGISFNGAKSLSRTGVITDANKEGLEGCASCGIQERKRGERQPRGDNLIAWSSEASFKDFPTQSPICSGDDGIPAELDGITFSKWRNESIKAYGNAIVPQVALQIFKAIEQYESLP